LPHWPQLAGGLVDTLGLEVAKRAGEHLAVQADDVVAPVVAGRVRGLGVEQPDLAGALDGEVALQCDEPLERRAVQAALDEVSPVVATRPGDGDHLCGILPNHGCGRGDDLAPHRSLGERPRRRRRRPEHPDARAEHQQAPVRVVGRAPANVVVSHVRLGDRGGQGVHMGVGGDGP